MNQLATTTAGGVVDISLGGGTLNFQVHGTAATIKGNTAWTGTEAALASNIRQN